MKLVAVLLLGLIVLASAHKHKHHQDEHGEKPNHHGHHNDDDDHEESTHNHKPHESDIHHQLRVCHYNAENGKEYDLRLMNQSSGPMLFQDPKTHGVVYFRPCRGVSNQQCDPDAAVCFVEPSGKAISFGTAHEIQWADGVEGGAAIEATYGNGEACTDGIPRKTVVEYKCTLQKPAPGVAPVTTAISMESRIVSAEVDSCFMKLVVESPHACTTSEYCHTISLESVCVSSTEGLCQWNNKGHCVAVENGCGRWRHASPVQIMAIVTLLTLFISLCLGLCCCACRAANKSRRRACSQKVESAGKMMQELEEIPEQEQQAPEQPTAPQYQPVPLFYPGQQIPLSPYSTQGYPVLQFIPVPQPKAEESA